MRKNMTKQSLENYYIEYIDAAIQHGEANLNPNPKIANKNYATLHRIYKYFQNHSDLAPEFYSKLYDHKDASVRTWASAHSLGLRINIVLAEMILETLAKDTSLGILRLNAQYTLENWKKQGYLIL
jgi:hypothetical protein